MGVEQGKGPGSWPVRRRGFLFSGLALVGLPAPGQAGPPRHPGLLVANPVGGRLDRWAEPISAMVGRGFPAHLPLSRSNLGGLDGVTGANGFEARVEPDGSTALLVPGAATLSWLVGETRARFDPARWLLLWATTAPAVLVSRVQPRAGSSLLIAASGPVGAELPALLALDLLGVRAMLTTTAQDADAVFLQGSDLATSLKAAASRGMNPVLTLGQVGADGGLGRDPLLPTVPSAVELVDGRASPRLLLGLLAACLAAQLDTGLILPQLTPADTVATWRRACQPLLQDSGTLAEAGRTGVRMLPATTASAYLGRIAGDADVLLGIREWLATRFNYRPT